MEKKIFALAEIMRSMKITTQELAEKTDIPKNTINEYRSARRKEPSLSRGLAIADVLEIDPHTLFMTPKELDEFKNGGIFNETDASDQRIE